MMENNDKEKLARNLGYGQNATDLPAHYAEVFDQLCDRTWRLNSNRTIRYSDFPMVALLAELIHKQQERIDTLEGLVHAARTATTAESFIGEPDEADKPADLRTAEGREWKRKHKEALVGA